MTLACLRRIAFFSLLIGLALPGIAVGQQGTDTYKAKCQGCHGPGGIPSEGMAKSMGLKPLGGPDVQKMSDSDLTAAITNGKGKMPGFKGKLTDAQISDLVKYIRTLKM
ncbi:MAG TPA: cytochrome c [Candidatus Binatia bacterium]|nr:cytochrome c [Candidatus Binatia bacterium]